MASQSRTPPKRREEPDPRSVSKKRRSADRIAGDSRQSAVCRRVCAWCGVELALETWAQSGEAELTTWGICSSCLKLREEMGGMSKSGEKSGAARHDDGHGMNVRGAEPRLDVAPLEDIPIGSTG